ncbi:MAG: hypothetical protein M1814_005849 [Vezdaea aestivalis]|nr:MAG: hypothetical protein M1814_005849 [Vezdaea aestivalis]
MWMHHIAPVSGFLKPDYTENGSHFTGNDIKTYFGSHGMQVTHAPSYHPQLVVLSERYVQMVISAMRKGSFANEEMGKAWSLSLQQIAPGVNTRLVKTHGHSPAAILLGYEPQWHHLKLYDNITQDNVKLVEATKDDIVLQELRREEIQTAIGAAKAAASMDQDQTEVMQVGDLIIIKDVALDKIRRRKLDPKWMITPRRIIGMIASECSIYITDIWALGKVQKYHIDNVKLYYQRQEQQLGGLIYEWGAMMKVDKSGTRPIEMQNGRKWVLKAKLHNSNSPR